MNTRAIGSYAEDKAVEFIQKSGKVLVTRNYVTPYGEADAIFIDNGQYVFVEIKARRTAVYGLPAHAVTRRKQKKYLHIAQFFFAENKTEDYSVRFDVAEVYITDGEPVVNYIENAFDFSDIDEFY